MLPLPFSFLAIISISCAPAATSSGSTDEARTPVSESAVLTAITGMWALLAAAICGPSESACTGTMMMASTFWLTSWSTWLAWVETSPPAEFQSNWMLLAWRRSFMPSCPWLMKEDMS